MAGADKVMAGADKADAAGSKRKSSEKDEEEAKGEEDGPKDGEEWSKSSPAKGEGAARDVVLRPRNNASSTAAALAHDAALAHAPSSTASGHDVEAQIDCPTPAISWVAKLRQDSNWVPL